MDVCKIALCVMRFKVNIQVQYPVSISHIKISNSLFHNSKVMIIFDSCSRSFENIFAKQVPLHEVVCW